METPTSDDNQRLDAVLFQHLFEHAQDGIVLVDGDDRIVRVNAAFVEMFGFSAARCAGRRVNELIVGTEFADGASRLSDQVLNGLTVRFESLRKTIDDDLLRVEISGIPIRDGAGQIAILGIYRDVTARRSAELLLQKSERQHRRIVESLDAGYFELDLSGNPTFVNGAFRTLFGLHRGAFSGRALLARVAPSDSFRMIRRLLSVIRHSRPDSGLTWKMQSPDGGERHLEASILPLEAADGRTAGVRGIVRDITHRVRAEAQLIENERIYRTMALSTGQLVYDCDLVSGSLMCLGAVETILGSDAADARSFTNREWRQRIHPEDRESTFHQVAIARQTGAQLQVEYRFLQREGHYIDVLDTGSFLADENGEWVRMVGTLADISERKRQQRVLHDTREQAQVTLDSIADAVIRTNLHGCVEYLNPVARALTGWNGDRAIGKKVDQVLKIETTDSAEPLHALKVLESLCADPHAEPAEMLLLSRDGTGHDIELSVSPIQSGQPEGGYVVIFRDVTATRESARQVRWQAEHDPLTGMFNRRKFEKEATARLDQHSRGGSLHSGCLLYMDLDQFKVVNDSCGHHAGDELLRRLADLLLRRTRRSDLLARLGGDEFALLLQDCTLEGGRERGLDLIEAINDFTFVWEGHRFHIGISIGLVQIEPGTTLIQALGAADAACYIAKDKGRNQLHVHQPTDLDQLRRGQELRSAVDVGDALADNRLRLYFQEIRPLQPDRSGRRYEILLRMLDRNGKLVSPEHFLPGAERYNKIAAVDRWVVEHVFRGLREARAQEGLGVRDRVAINLSGATFAQPDFLDFVRQRFATNDVNPANICFEITESAAISGFSAARKFIQTMRSLGCSIMLDDFGGGFSSFSYLKKLPVDGLKIDGSLIAEIGRSELDRAMVSGIVEIAHAGGIACVAEQVERRQDLDRLATMGVQWAQGFHIHRPEPWPWNHAQEAVRA